MREPIEFCKKECRKEMTFEDVTTSTECNFCDVPYVLMDLDKLNTYNELIKSKETFETMVKEYKKNIRTFFENYKCPDFNGVINTLEINFKPSSPSLYPCEITAGWQTLPLKSIMDFCDIFDYYLPNIQIEEFDGRLKHVYTFKKKIKEG